MEDLNELAKEEGLTGCWAEDGSMNSEQFVKGMEHSDDLDTDFLLLIQAKVAPLLRYRV